MHSWTNRWITAAVAMLLLSGAVLAAPKKPKVDGPVGIASMGPGSAYIELAINDSTGQFTMGVPGGGPILLYGHPSPGTSFSTVRIDGGDYTNDFSPFQGSVIQAPTTAGNTNEGIWQVGSTPLRVHQIITLVTSTTTGLEDTYLIQYKVDNLDTVSHTIGCRVMLDTKIGDNDNAPFQVPGTGSISTETEWTGSQVPPYFFVFDDLYNPTTTCQGTLLGGQVSTAPDVFQVADWGNLTYSQFDYTVDPIYPIYDTAYAPYWINRTVAAGQSITFGTYYGLGSVAVNTAPPLATALAAPTALTCLGGMFTPNPFAASLYLSNTLPGQTGTVYGVTCTLSLPSGLALASGTLTQTVGDMILGASVLKSWNIQATGSATGTLTYSIQVNSTNAGSKTLTGQVYVPPGCVQAGCGTYVVTDDNENNARTGAPDGDWHTCVFNDDPNHPIEFNLPVTGALPLTSAKLLLLCNDVDETSGEVDEVYFNGHLLGTLTGANNQDSTTLFTISDLSWVLAGNNFVEILVDRQGVGNWCVELKQAQLVLDGGCPATASCRSITTNKGSYDFGEQVSATTEVDTTLASQEVRLETNILDPSGVNVAGADATFTTTGSSNDAHTIDLPLPSSGASGLYTVESLIFDTATNQLQSICQTNIAVGSVTNCPATFLLNQVDASACPTVKVVVSVLDATGAPVTGLPSSAFCLKEDGASITSFTVTTGATGGGNLFTALVVDNSGSLGSTAFADEKNAAKTFVGLLGAGDQAAVYGFTSAVDLVMDFSADKTALGAAIDGYPYKGGMTAFYDGAYQALSNTGTRSGRKAVIAMTDGEDNSSSHSQADLIAYAQSLGIPIFTIGFGSADALVLDAIATQTGGKYYSAASSGNLQAILQSIGAIVSSQYVITYTTTKVDGQSHTLEPCVNVPGCTLLTALGTFQCGAGGACPVPVISQVDTSACPTVKVVVSVANPAGQPVTGLAAGNFCLSEAGVSKTFTLSTGSSGGNNLFLALNIDNSGSLGSAAFADEKAAAKALVNLLGASDQAAVYGFTSQVDLVQDFTSTKATLVAAIDAYPYKGGSTAFYDSVYQSLSNTSTRTGRKAIVAMTDGEDNSSGHTQAELIAYAQSLGIPVFTIGFGGADQVVLEAISTQTGGRFYASASSANLQQVLTDIAGVINSQYVLTYTTTQTDGLSHPIDVCVQGISGCATVHTQGTMQCGSGSGSCPILTLAQVDTSSCPTVRGIVSVTTAAGQPITGLTASSFCVSEDGSSITNFTVTPASTSGLGLFLAMAIDNSGSLGSTAFNDEKTAAKALVNLLGTSDQAAVYGFTSTVDLVQDFTSNKSTLTAAIDAYPYKGGSTAFYDAVWMALANTATRTGRKAVVAMTDGEDNSSSHTKNDLILYAQNLGIPVYAIAFSSADQVVLQEIATQTGGQFFASASSANLQQILTAIGNLLNSQYVISYTTTKTDGAIHSLDYCVTYGGCTQHVQGSFRCGSGGSCPSITIAQVDTSACPTVKAVVTVLDSLGNPIQGLTASSFCLNEDQIPQNFTVTGAGQSGSTLYVGVNIDNSGSLGSTQFTLEKNATKTFIGLLGATDQVAIWGFDSTVDFVIDFTADKPTLYSVIDAYAYSGGSTAFFDSTYASLVATAAKTGRKAILAMTDGEDNSSSHTKDEIIAYAQQYHIPVYTIGFGSPDEVVMQEIATQTGGKYYRGTDAAALQQILTDIGNLINNQYVISYDTTTNDGTVHSLDVCVTYQGCTAHGFGSVQCGSSCSVTCDAYAPTAAFAGIPAAFYASAVPVNCQGSSVGYEWNFGDGSTLSWDQAPTHAYAANGTYTWTLRATASGATACQKTGTVTVTTASCVKPAIMDQPLSQVLAYGATATLSVTSQGTTNHTYQWYEGESGSTTHPVSGAIQSTFTTPAITTPSKYWVRVSATCGYVNSQTALLGLVSGLQAWGDNAQYQLGDGTTADRSSPSPVPSLSGALSVAAGDYHSAVVDPTGHVWTWGDNDNGQIGNGTFGADVPTPYQVTSLSGTFTQVAAGEDFTLALRSDGTVWGWGDNDNGQLGDGSTTDRYSPVQASGLTGVTAISAGDNHAIALKSNGTIWAWGDNANGQMGDGTSTDHLVPFQVPVLSGTFTAMDAGSDFNLVRKSDGTVWAWGYNSNGQLGDNTTTTRRSPQVVAGLPSVVSVASGHIHSLAVTSTGSLYAWGDNAYGQLGDGTIVDKRVPTLITGISGVSKVSGGYLHSQAVKTDKSLWAWGDNSHGQLGDGTTADRTTPVQVNNILAALAISAGRYHNLAIAPAVTAVANPASGSAPLLVTFSANAAGGTAPYSYAWTFGDGGTGTGSATSHTYTSAGTYSAQVTITDAVGLQARTVMTVTVVNFSVTISGTPTTGPPPLIVAFTSTLTGGTSPFVYQWRFGDGGLDATANPSHTYTSPGAFKATLVVTDSTGRVAKSNTVSIQSKAPILLTASAKPYRVKINEVVPFRANASGGSGYFTTFAWTFGDGGTGTGSAPTHAYVTAGTYKAKVVVTDSTSATKTSPDVTIFVYGPVSASSITPTSASPGVAKTFGVTVTGGDGRYTYAWSFGDGGTATGATPTHTYTTAGTKTVSVTVTDGLGQTATTSRSLTVVNPPVITLMKKASPPFKITVTGTNLQNGITVYINGTPWSGVVWKKTTKVLITGSTLKTAVPKGTPTLFRFVNPDGGEASLTWQW